MLNMTQSFSKSFILVKGELHCHHIKHGENTNIRAVESCLLKEVGWEDRTQDCAVDLRYFRSDHNITNLLCCAHSLVGKCSKHKDF